jgi:GST-like protein
MFELYAEKSPAVYKVVMMLEECELPYKLIYLSVSQGKQHEPAFRKLNPNGKIPVLIDHAPAGGGAPITIFESGAILLYLADKTGRLLPKDTRARSEVMQWVFWQSSGLSPMSGQGIHFTRYAPEEAKPYGLLRYLHEIRRCYGVLDQHLTGRTYICGDYSIADIGSYPWTALHMRLGIDVSPFPNMKRWLDAVAARPAVQRAYARMDADLPAVPAPSAEQYKHLFGEAAAALKAV